jgi:hypothetical protein
LKKIADLSGTGCANAASGALSIEPSLMTWNPATSKSLPNLKACQI